MNLIIFGPPGSGKGTQAERLCKTLRVRHVSTGELLREAVSAKSPLGLRVEAVMAAGELVSDDVVLELIREAVSRTGEQPWSGWLLDGFPRTPGQARDLDRLLAESGVRIDAVVVLDVDREVIVDRLTKRGRADDTVETVNNRLDVYEAQSRPVLDHYEGKVPIHRIDGARDVEAVTADIESALR